MHERNIFWGCLIAQLRARGYTQKALAQRVGVNQATMCRLAEGRAPDPRFGVGVALLAIAAAEDVSPGLELLAPQIATIQPLIDHFAAIERGERSAPELAAEDAPNSQETTHA